MSELDRELFELLKDNRIYEFKIFLEKNQLDINSYDEHGQTFLMIASEKGHLEIVKILIDNGSYIDLEYEHNGDYTALTFAIINGHKNIVLELLCNKASSTWFDLKLAFNKQNKDIIEYLLCKKIEDFERDDEFNADFIVNKTKEDSSIINLFNGENRKWLYSEAYKKDDQELMSLTKKEIKIKSKSRQLVNILTNFRKDTPIKYTTHLWDMNFNKEYGNFDGYIKKVEEQWNIIQDDLKSLSPNIHEIIYNFLLNKEASKNWCSKDGDAITIGWSSLVGLREWCNEGNDPFAFRLEKSYKIEEKTITNFGEIINIFKQEIQIRNENNVLENIFIDIEEKLDDEFDGVFEIEIIKLKGKSFYTDVEKFKNVLDRIFSEIKKRQEFNKIRVEVKEDKNEKYIELYITQIGSKANRSKEEMLNISNGGDMATIKENLKNLCDWSIESSDENESYRVNYLESDNIADTMVLDTIPDGFTHIMRFYR